MVFESFDCLLVVIKLLMLIILVVLRPIGWNLSGFKVFLAFGGAFFLVCGFLVVVGMEGLVVIFVVAVSFLFLRTIFL